MTDNKPQPETIVTIREEPIDLFKVLKLDGMVSGGGEAKLLIAGGQVRLNGDVETRKRKKVFNNDRIEYLGRRIRIVVAPPPIIQS